MIKTDIGVKVHNATNESVFVVRVTAENGINWYLVFWKGDNVPTLYNEHDFKSKFM